MNRVIGGPRTCRGLSALGRLQVQRLATRLAEGSEIEVDALYSSAFARAIESAELLTGALRRDVIVDEGLGEHDPGPICDGLGYDEFVSRYGAPDWESDPYAVTFPGGETVAQFQHRVWSTMSGLVDRHRGQVVLIVCHGGVIDTVLRGALRCSPTGIFELFTTNASMTELLGVGPGRWRLLRYNDAAHLAGLEAATPRAAGK